MIIYYQIHISQVSSSTSKPQCYRHLIISLTAQFGWKDLRVESLADGQTVHRYCACSISGDKYMLFAPSDAKTGQNVGSSQSSKFINQEPTLTLVSDYATRPERRDHRISALLTKCSHPNQWTTLRNCSFVSHYYLVCTIGPCWACIYIPAAEINKKFHFEGLRVYGLLTDLSSHIGNPMDKKFAIDETVPVNHTRELFFANMIKGIWCFFVIGQRLIYSINPPTSDK